MIEDAQEIFNYLPISFRNQAEQEYIGFLWDAFVTNYEAQKYSFAFLAYHMLFMSFVYFEIWQIKTNNLCDFEKAMVGFNKEMENVLLKASTPFTLWQVNESSVFRFLKLIGMNNTDIGVCTKIVKERNDIAHSNGNIFYKNQFDIDTKIEEIMQCVEKIQSHSANSINAYYDIFLRENSDPEKRQYMSDRDQILEILVYGNYLSSKDLAILKKFDVTKLHKEKDYENIKNLTKALIEMYTKEYEGGGETEEEEEE